MPRNMTWQKTNRNWLLYLTIMWPMGGPWLFKAAKVHRPSAISLEVWVHETNTNLTPYPYPVLLVKITDYQPYR